MRQALEMALEFIERVNKDGWILADFEPQMYEAITAIKEALAQPEQEPVGKFAKFTDGIWREVTDGSAGVSLYTTPPQRTWVDLTDDEMLMIYGQNHEGKKYNLGRMVQSQLKEKNT